MTTTVNWIRSAVKALKERKAIDVVALDVRHISSLTDFFIFAGATSYVHVQALEDTVRETLRREGAEISGIDGKRGHSWRVIDYGNIMIHIMEQPIREFYGVERLWVQGKPVSIKSAPKKKVKKKKVPKKKPK